MLSITFEPFMLSIYMLNAIMLSVVVPFTLLSKCFGKYAFTNPGIEGISLLVLYHFSLFLSLNKPIIMQLIPKNNVFLFLFSKQYTILYIKVYKEIVFEFVNIICLNR